MSVFKHVKDFLYANRKLMLLTIPFWTMDLVIRILGYKIDYYQAYMPIPNLFTLIYVMLFMGIASSVKGNAGKIIYGIFFIPYFVMFATNIIYYNLTGFYFDFHLTQMMDEGSSYIWETITGTPVWYYILMVVILAMGIYAIVKFPKGEKFRGKRLIVAVVAFVVVHTAMPLFMGGNSELKWNSFKKARNIYENYSDVNKSMKLSGLYEYTVRNLYMTFLKPEEKLSGEDEAFLKTQYDPEAANEENQYTGKFTGKNVIFLQLEGMDSWLLSEETTPNLYKLKNESMDFTEHYSLYTGGGSTFNSEFAVNTGFTTPVSYTQNVYTLNDHTFDHTMAKLFKEQGYSVNAFHMNSSDFYSRGINYRSWGFDNYYGLVDIADYKNDEEELDRELILNKDFYDLMFKQDGPFVDYIITYTPHTPFETEDGVGRLVAEMKYGKGNIPSGLTEEDVVKLEAAETDYMVGLLIQALKDNDLYDNTVIVAYADHYLYTIRDKSILDKYKETDNNLINHTPFFIWSSDGSYEEVNAVNMQMNILPTVLNLFGITYNPTEYLGRDILAPDYEGLAYFSDYSWYNGQVYVENGKVTSGSGNISDAEVEATQQKVNDLIRKNDLILKYDYFRHER